MTDSNSGVKAGSLTVGLLGAWRGEATDPARSFQGQVVVSDLEALPVGTEVAVQFRDSGRRVTGAHDHGAYVLSARGREWPVPFDLAPLLALRGRRVAMLVSGDPFWFGAGGSVARCQTTVAVNSAIQGVSRSVASGDCRCY